MLRGVNLGDDADTTGAICGQLAGAYWGEMGIPEEWRTQLAGRNMLERACSTACYSRRFEFPNSPFKPGDSLLPALDRTKRSSQLRHPAIERGTLAIELLAKSFQPGSLPRIDGRLPLGTQNASADC